MTGKCDFRSAFDDGRVLRVGSGDDDGLGGFAFQVGEVKPAFILARRKQNPRAGFRLRDGLAQLVGIANGDRR
jgi:hypothetical protein